MEIPKPSEADKEFFRSVLPDDPSVEVKPMFGNLGAFVHGNMFAGLFGPAVGVRLDDAAREELEGIDGSGPFGPAERPPVHGPPAILARGYPWPGHYLGPASHLRPATYRRPAATRPGCPSSPASRRLALRA